MADTNVRVGNSREYANATAADRRYSVLIVDYSSEKNKLKASMQEYDNNSVRQSHEKQNVSAPHSTPFNTFNRKPTLNFQTAKLRFGDKIGRDIIRYGRLAVSVSVVCSYVVSYRAGGSNKTRKILIGSNKTSKMSSGSDKTSKIDVKRIKQD